MTSKFMKPFGVILQAVEVPRTGGATMSASMPHRLNRRQVITAGTFMMTGVAARPSSALAEPNAEISRDEESIHQERASRRNASASTRR